MSREMILDMHCKTMGETMDNLSIGDIVRCLNNDYNVIKGKIVKFNNWYSMTIEGENGKKWGISAMHVYSYENFQKEYFKDE